MKSYTLCLLIAMTAGLRAQHHGDDSIVFDPFHLSEIVVIDKASPDAAMAAPTALDHRLELKLKQLKGVSLISRGAFAQEVMYRGQSDARLQVKVNGMRIYSACTDKMDPSTSYIVSENLKAAEMKSACASSCADNGLAGSLNLEIKPADFDSQKPFRWAFDQQYHSNTGGVASALNLQGHQKKLAWRLSGNWQQHGNYLAGGGQEVAHSQSHKHNWALNSSYRLSDRELLQLDLIYDLAQKVGFPALPMDVGTARALIAGATYQHAGGIGPFSRFEFKVYHNDLFHEMDDSEREEVAMRMDMPGWSQTSGLSFNAFNWQEGSHKVDLSAEYYTNYRKAEMTMYPEGEASMYMLSWPAARRHGGGMGLSDHWHQGKNHFQLTLRVDYEISLLSEGLGVRQWEGMGFSQPRQQYLLPQLKSALKRQINAVSDMEWALGFGQRGPSTSELYGFYLFNAQDGYDYLGNPALKPESLLNSEWSYYLKGHQWQASGTIFLQQYFDYIFGVNTEYDAMTPSAKGLRNYNNIASARFLGLELSGQYQFGKDWQARGRLDFLRGLKGDEDLPMVPPLGASLAMSYTPANWELNLQGQLVADQPHYNVAYGDRYTPGYGLLDLSLAYKFPLQSLDIALALAVNNLFDQGYRNHLNWGGIPSMGRNLIFNIRLSAP